MEAKQSTSEQPIRATRDPGLIGDAHAKREARIAAVSESLRHEFIEALHKGPQTLLSTRHLAPHLDTAAAYIEDGFSNPVTGDAVVHELLQIVAGASRGEDVQLRASLWIDAQAAEFGEWFAGDLVACAEDDE